MSRSRHPRLALAAACGSTVLVMALVTVALMSIPVLGRDLGASQTALQWVGDSYPLLLAALLLPAGALLDRHGRKRGMLIGLALVLGALLLTTLADSTTLVLVGRVISGVGSALVFPGTLATIAASVGADERRRGTMLWAASVLGGGFLGLLTAAVVIAATGSWRAPFAVFAVFAAALMVITALAIPETCDPDHAALDPLGAVLGLVCAGATVLCLTEGPVLGWLAPLIAASAAIGAATLVAFIVWELRCTAPLLDVRLFRDGRFGSAAAAVFLLFLGDYAAFFLANQYMSYVLGWGPARTGLALVPPVLGTVVAIPFVPILMRSVGARGTIALALILCAVGTLVLALMAHHGSYLAITPGLFIFWAGLGLGMAPPTEAILHAMPDAKHGVASAVNDLSRELGAALGIALAGAAFNAAYRADVGSALGPHARLARIIVNSPAAGLRSVARIAGAPSTRLRDVIEHGVLAGWRVAFAILAACLVAGAVFVVRRYPSRSEEQRLGRAQAAKARA